jgi:ankyrin repeat protein
VEDINILIKAGADINAPGEYGNRPLHEAVSQGKVEAVKTLMKFCANTKIKNDDGLTAGDLAKLLENEEIKQLMGVV